ncbi:morphogenetic protein [Klebsiella pneumoniae]|uniref:morphogenetic protein n=1 Tax=Klebsiella pneumoniae TaxID=573 RepID=UPI001F1CCD6E|nr:morphogenetic protein [Klebsiella pneumoniae]MCF2841950.1 morphogenetic protein [Klebsiella pneumoniae]
MKERGMIFNAEMVRALLDGRKTQTRRVIANVGHDNCLPLQKRTKTKDGIYTHVMDAHIYGLCPFGKIGDRIWVRETWSDVNLDGAPAVAYRADDEVYDLMEDKSLLDEDGAFNYQDPRVRKYQFAAWHSDLISGIEGNWRPSIHMPRWASRITLEITGVRVERLNSISQEDAQAEGLELTGWRPTYSDPDSGGEVMTPYDNFAELWSSIYGDESWQANPWVWVIEFKRVEGGAA